MRKLLGVLLTSSVCLVLSFSATGCGEKTKAKGFSMKSGGAPEATVKREKKTFTMTLEHGSIEGVEVDPKESGVNVTKTDKEVTVEIVPEKLPDGEKKFKVTIKGIGEDKKTKKDTTIEFTVKAKEGMTPPEFAAKTGNDVALTLEKGAGEAKVEFKGKVKSADLVEKTAGIVVTTKDEWVIITAKDAKPGKFDVKVTPAEEKATAVTLKVTAADKTEKPPADKDLVLDKDKSDKELPKFDKDEAKKNVITLMFSEGKVAGVEIDPKDYKGVTVDGKDDWVKITVTKDAKPEDVIKIKVKAVGDKKGVDVTITKGKVAVSFLNDRNDQRFNEPRVLAAVITTEKFVALSRRM